MGTVADRVHQGAEERSMHLLQSRSGPRRRAPRTLLHDLEHLPVRPRACDGGALQACRSAQRADRRRDARADEAGASSGGRSEDRDDARRLQRRVEPGQGRGRLAGRTILPVFLAPAAVGTGTALGSLLAFALVTVTTIVGLTLLATLGGYQLRARWLDRWGNAITALVLLIIGALVLARII